MAAASGGVSDRPAGFDLHEMQNAVFQRYDVQLVAALPPVEGADVVSRAAEVFGRGAFAGLSRLGCGGHQRMMR